MDPGNDSPVSRAERTFWTVWYYISEAVSRFLRPEPANIVSNDPNTSQEHAVNSGPVEIGEEVNEEEPLAPVSLLTSSDGLGPDEEHTQGKTQLSEDTESKLSEEHDGTREEQFSQTGNDDAGHARAKEDDEEEENSHEKLWTLRQVESQEKDQDEEYAKMGPLSPTDDAVGEGMNESITTDGTEEETQTMTPKPEHEKMYETMTEVTLKEDDNNIHHENDLEAEDTDYDINQEENIHIEEARVPSNDADAAVMCEEVENELDVLQAAPENEHKSDEGEEAQNHVSVCEQLTEKDMHVKGDTDKEHVMTHRLESDKVGDDRYGKNESILHEGEQYEEENKNETAHNQKVDEKPEQDKDVETVAEVTQDTDILTEHITCSKDVTLNAETELHTAELTDEEQEDVAKITKSKAREIDDVGTVIREKPCVTTTDVLVNEILFEKDQVEEERLTSEEDDNKSYMEIACTITSVEVKPEAKAGQEARGELKNISPGMCEGRVVVSPELNSPTCEETEEGVPEYNNVPGPDENTTQRFLEVGDCEGIQTTQLPEEVESREPESLQNSGSNTGAVYLLTKEHREEEQVSTENIYKEHIGELHVADTELSQKTDQPLVEQVIQESGLLFDKEEVVSVHSMKTEIEHTEKAFETHLVFEDGTTDLHDETEELLVEFQTGEGLSDFRDVAGDGDETTGAVATGEVVEFADETSKVLDTEVPKMMETSVFQETVDTITSDQNCNMIPTLLQDISESGFLKESVDTEPKISGDTVEIQDAGIDMEVGYELEEGATKYEPENETLLGNINLQLVEIAAETTQDTVNNESVMTAESELVKTFEICNDEMLIDTEADDELISTEINSLTMTSTEEMENITTESERSYPEETSCSVSGHDDAIDEEILDLWIQAVSAEDTDQTKEQDGPEPGQQIDTKIEQSMEEQAEISVQAELEKEQHVESNSGVNDTEMSSLTAESGFLDQSLTSEWDTQTSETQPLNSNSMESFQDTYDMLASVSESADISEVSTQQSTFESQAILMEEAADAEQSDLEEEQEGHQNQQSNKPQEKSEGEQIELAEAETEPQKDTDAEITDLEIKFDRKDTEEVGVESQRSAEEVEDVSLEITASDSPDEIEHDESGRPRSGLEVLLEEGIVSAESGSQVDTWIESEQLFKLPSLEQPQLDLSEDIADSLPELNRAEEFEHSTAKFEGLLEVDTASLDFTAQRSRIALKDPRVRPPKDPRSLLHMPSLEPTPSSHLPVKVPAGLPLAGLGVGIKLPGLGAGFPVLKKTRVVKEDSSPETSKEPEPEDKSETPKQDEAPKKPKWMPPKHPGFGNPLMSELKTKLKKTTKE